MQQSRSELERSGAPAVRPRVRCTGMATADRIYRVERLGALEGVYDGLECLHHDGGAAATAAITVARLGGRASFAGCVGADDVGDRVLLRLAAAGVAVDGVQRVDQPTPVRSIVHDAVGNRVIFAHTAAGYFAAADPAGAEVVDDADVVLVDGLWIEGSIRTLAAARRAGIPGVVDVVRPLGDDFERVVDGATHVLFSSEALMAAAHIRDEHLALAQLHHRVDAWVGVTEGSHGTSWIHEHGLEHQAAFDVGVNDTLGAGDVYRGAFALALAEGRTGTEAVRFATAAAAAKCRRNGGDVDMPNRAEVDELLHTPPPDLLPWRNS